MTYWSGACRQADDVARCEDIIRRDGPEARGSMSQPIVSPFLLEARQGRAAVAKLLAAIDIPEAETEQPDDVLSRRAARASKAGTLRRQRARGLHGAA